MAPPAPTASPADPSGPRSRLAATVLRRIVLVHEREAGAFVLAVLYFFCLMCANGALRPLRDDMGIAGGVKNLPWLFTGTLAAMLALNPVFSFMVGRLPRRRFIPIVYRFFALNMLLFFALSKLLPASAGINLGRAFYIWMSVFNLFAVTVFWGFMADVFTPEQGKRLFGAIGVGGTLGALAGASVAASIPDIAARLGPELGTLASPVNLLLIAAVLMEAAVWCVWGLTRIFGLAAGSTGATPPRTPEPGVGVLDGIALVGRSPYLLALCVYMLLYTISSTFLYFEQGRLLEAGIQDRAARTAFLARIDQWAQLLTLVTQLFVSGRIILRIGIGGALAVLPVLTGGGFAALEILPTLGTLMAVQVTRRGLHYAVDRPAREALYTVLSPEEKYKSKSFIDTAVYRTGDQVGAWVTNLLPAVGSGLGWIVGSVALVWIALAAFLGARQRRLATDAATSAIPARPNRH